MIVASEHTRYFVTAFCLSALSILKIAAGEGASIHIMSGKNSDSGVDISQVHDAAVAAPAGASIRRDVLFNVLAECRVTKSAGELDLMSYASWISSMAHVDVMREVHPGMLEYQLEARFLYHIAYHGNTHVAAPGVLTSLSSTCCQVAAGTLPTPASAPAGPTALSCTMATLVLAPS